SRSRSVARSGRAARRSRRVSTTRSLRLRRFRPTRTSTGRDRPPTERDRVGCGRGTPPGSRLHSVTSELPLFPLGTVLFPGLVMPLHSFEARYRALVRNLMALPDGPPREFGVVAIRRGLEVGAGAEVTLYEVGCTAEVRQVTEHEDGRFDLVTVGRRRFEIAE